MRALQNMVRSRLVFNHHYLLVMMLASIVINAFRRLDQKPNQIQHKPAYKVENCLVYSVAGNDASVVKYHVADGVLHPINKWHDGAFDRIQKTHNRYSTIRREIYKCLNESIVTMKSFNLQSRGMNFSCALQDTRAI